jgi:hypothetical protein
LEISSEGHSQQRTFDLFDSDFYWNAVTGTVKEVTVFLSPCSLRKGSEEDTLDLGCGDDNKYTNLSLVFVMVI